MAQLIAPDIVRYSVEGTINGRPWANVIDCRLNDSIVDQRRDAIEDLGERILGAYAGFRSILVASWVVTRIRWVDLDNANGSVGETTEGGTTDAPFTGQIAATGASSANVAYLLRKRGAGGRQARSGRLYLPGVAEGSTEGNTVSSTARATLQTAATALLAACKQESIGPDQPGDSSAMVVVHAPGGQFTGATEVEALVVDGTLASQRRRLRG